MSTAISAADMKELVRQCQFPTPTNNAPVSLRVVLAVTSSMLGLLHSMLDDVSWTDLDDLSFIEPVLEETLKKTRNALGWLE